MAEFPSKKFSAERSNSWKAIAYTSGGCVNIPFTSQGPRDSAGFFPFTFQVPQKTLQASYNLKVQTYLIFFVSVNSDSLDFSWEDIHVSFRSSIGVSSNDPEDITPLSYDSVLSKSSSSAATLLLK
jgi:hypothetical protein